MSMTTCPHCNVSVVVMADGYCPSCRRSIDGPNYQDTPAYLMPPRPTSITVICWILIVLSAMSIVVSLLTMKSTLNDPTARELMAANPLPIPVQFAIMYIGLLVMLISGLAMLNGNNWGRWLYAIWSAVGMAIGLATSPAKLMLLPGALVYLVVVLFLFRPNATAYFTGSNRFDEQRV